MKEPTVAKQTGEKEKPVIPVSRSNPLGQGDFDRSVREHIPIPDAPPASELSEEPIPEGWIQFGIHTPMARMESRMFATTVDTSELPETLAVTYLHPSNSGEVVIEYEAVEDSDGKFVPKPVWETYKILKAPDTKVNKVAQISRDSLQEYGISPFVLSFGILSPFEGQPREVSDAERELMWARYSDYLIKNTFYLPPGLSHSD